MNRFVLIGLLLLSTLMAAAQEDVVLGISGSTLSWFNPTTNTDSLKAILPETAGREKVHLLCELSYASIKSGMPGAYYKKYLNEAWHVSEQLEYNNGMVMQLFLLSVFYDTEEKDTILTINTLQKAETFFDQETHWSLKHRIWISLGMKYTLLGNTDSSLYYFQMPIDYLPDDSAWFSHIISNVFLMRHAALANDHEKTRYHLENTHDLLQSHETLITWKGLYLLNYFEELSIVLENYGEYRDASSLLLQVLNKLNNTDDKSLYTEFFTAKILGRLARIYTFWGKNDSALYYFDKSIRHFDQLYEEYKAAIYNPDVSPCYRLWSINSANQLEERAVLLTKTGELNQAESDLMLSINIRKEHNDPLGIAMCYEKLGELNALRGDFLEALNWYHQALALKDTLRMDRGNRLGRDAKFALFYNQSIASTYLKIGRFYKEWNRPQPALQHLRHGLAISRETGFQRCEAEVLTAIGDVYASMNEPDSTLGYYAQAREMFENLDYKPGIADIYESMGDYYKRQSLNSTSMNYYNQSLKILEKLEMNTSIAGILVKQGNLFLENGSMQEALDKYHTGLDWAVKLNLPRQKMEAYKGLSDVFLSQGSFEQAYRNLIKFHEMKDRLFSLEIDRHMTEIEAQYETEKNKQKVLLLEQEKELIEEREIRSRFILLIILAFLMFIIFGIFLYSRQARLEKEHEMMRIQQRLFRSQMNPHFIFNSLGAIQGSILNDEPDNAARYLSLFAKLMRNILDSSEHDQIPLRKEISIIENYLELQKIRFPEKVEYQMSGVENIDIEDITIPPMLIQPFLENAVEHGIRHLESKGLIRVAFSLKNNFLTIRVTDNGIGRKNAKALSASNNSNHQSMAIDITRRRIEVLNKQSKFNIHFKISDLFHSDGISKGTKVVFTIPV